MISNSVMVSMIVTIVLAAAGIIVPFVMIYITARKKRQALLLHLVWGFWLISGHSICCLFRLYIL